MQPDTPTRNEFKKTVVLAGGGHSHLEVLKAFSKGSRPNLELILISPVETIFYSGLMPQWMAGQISTFEAQIDLKEYAESIGARFVLDSVLSIQSKEKMVLLKSGAKLPFDYLSLNIGGEQSSLDADPAYKLIPIKPFHRFIDTWESLQSEKEFQQIEKICLLGNGAAVFELAIGLTLSRQHPKEIEIIHTKEQLCSYLPPKAVSKLEEILKKSGVRCVKVPSFENWLKNEEPDNKKIMINAIAHSANALIEKKCDPYLQLSQNIFASGDCVDFQITQKVPKSGVLAVHQGRLLAKNLLFTLQKKPLISFKPRKSYLSILVTGKKRALATWGPFWIEGQLPWILKNWIDLNYLKKFRKSKV